MTSYGNCKGMMIGYNTIRNTAYNVGRELGRKYKVHLNREKMCCEVKRLKI